MSRLLDGYRLNGSWHAPSLQTVSFYVDQFPFNDMAREQAAEYGIRICRSVTGGDRRASTGSLSSASTATTRAPRAAISCIPASATSTRSSARSNRKAESSAAERQILRLRLGGRQVDG